MSASSSAPSERSGGRGARGRILDTARELFGERGINATGVAELAAAAHVSKRTLYQHFTSKDELVVAYLRAWEAGAWPSPERVLDRDDLTPRARLLELFAALGAEPHPMRGCPFVNAAVELADPAHPAHRFAAAHKHRFVARLAGLARSAGARDAERVGRRLALLYDGAAARALVSDSAEPAAEARMIAATVLQDAIDQRR